MLKRLKVKNYVLIDELEINFDLGLTIITGETGAGKSILLGALGLILGQRADVGSLLEKDKKCLVEGIFDISKANLQDFFSEHDLDFENITTIRREINTEGKSRAFVNDTPVNISVLKDLTSRLVDIHSQHETLLLNNSQFQMNVVDACSENANLLADYKQALSNLNRVTAELNNLIAFESKGKADLDYFQFQFDELDAANLVDGEVEDLEAEQQKLIHADEISSQLIRVTDAMRNGDDNVVQNLGVVIANLQSVTKYDASLEQLIERLKSSIVELKDINAELENSLQSIDINPSRLEIVNDRLTMIYKLIQKHRCDTIAELITVKDDYESKLSSIQNLENQITEKKKEIELLREKTTKYGLKLRATRSKVVPGLEQQIKAHLSELALPFAQIKIEINPAPENTFYIDGMEKVQFMFSANKGLEFREIQKVASGGEMSRLMLSIKAILAQKVAMPTVIFDEIDTGISGETASRLGNILKLMSKNHQVFAITHLPQMASKGAFHYFVFKETTKNSTRTRLKLLDYDERINEIARMLSGEKLSAAAIGNAKELLTAN
jgi:DNA repair protein RecN (Recombination protein N)